MLVNLGASRTRYVSQRLSVHELNVEKNGVSALVEYLDGKRSLVVLLGWQQD